MYFVVTHDSANVTSDNDCAAFHRRTLDCTPRPFVHRRIIYFVIFNTSIVALIFAAIPIDEDSQLHVVNPVLAYHHVRSAFHTHTATILNAIEPYFKSLDPKPVPTIRIKCMAKTRYIQGMSARIIQDAQIEFQSSWLKIPALAHWYTIVSSSLQQVSKTIVHVKPLLITRQVLENRCPDFSEPDMCFRLVR